MVSTGKTPPAFSFGIRPFGVLTEGGRSLVRQRVGFLMDEDLEGCICSMKIPARARQGLRRNSLPQEMLENTMSTIITITITIIQHPSS